MFSVAQGFAAVGRPAGCVGGEFESEDADLIEGDVDRQSVRRSGQGGAVDENFVDDGVAEVVGALSEGSYFSCIRLTVGYEVGHVAAWLGSEAVEAGEETVVGVGENVGATRAGFAWGGSDGHGHGDEHSCGMRAAGFRLMVVAPRSLGTN